MKYILCYIYSNKYSNFFNLNLILILNYLNGKY